MSLLNEGAVFNQSKVVVAKAQVDVFTEDPPERNALAHGDPLGGLHREVVRPHRALQIVDEGGIEPQFTTVDV